MLRLPVARASGRLGASIASGMGTVSRASKLRRSGNAVASRLHAARKARATAQAFRESGSSRSPRAARVVALLALAAEAAEEAVQVAG